MTLKSYVLEAAVPQIKAWLSEPLINHFWALACVLSVKSRPLVRTSTAAVYFSIHVSILGDIKEQPSFPLYARSTHRKSAAL